MRGLPGGSGIARLLAEHRGVRIAQFAPDLTVPQILTWMDEYHQRHGCWPNRHSGPIEGTHGETWMAVEGALSLGRRGLPPGSSIPRLLASRRGVLNSKARPPLTEETILEWCDSFFALHGRYPVRSDGVIAASPQDKWSGINSALWTGTRGLPGRLTLAALLRKHRPR